jgi:hypothetical protein|uniref:Uncharacterized protein n=1 Tax=Zea mays TaxID=4577 RepID=A0A804LFM7_MAIZE
MALDPAATSAAWGEGVGRGAANPGVGALCAAGPALGAASQARHDPYSTWHAPTRARARRIKGQSTARGHDKPYVGSGQAHRPDGPSQALDAALGWRGGAFVAAHGG